MSIYKGILGIFVAMLLMASQSVIAGDECRGGACRADERIPVCLLPPPTDVADSRGVSNARTSARTVIVQVSVADQLIGAGAATPGECL